jgi:hypothetical protein
MALKVFPLPKSGRGYVSSGSRAEILSRSKSGLYYLREQKSMSAVRISQSGHN